METDRKFIEKIDNLMVLFRRKYVYIRLERNRLEQNTPDHQEQCSLNGEVRGDFNHDLIHFSLHFLHCIYITSASARCRHMLALKIHLVNQSLLRSGIEGLYAQELGPNGETEKKHAINKYKSK